MSWSTRPSPLRAVPGAAGVVVLSVLLASCLPTSAADGMAPEQRSIADCQPFTPYGDIDALAAAFASAPSLTGWVGGDIAADATIGGDQTIFAFGDTIVDSSAAAAPTVRNSILSFHEGRSCLVLGPDGAAFVSDRADGVGYWPTSMVQVEPDQRLALFLQRVTGSPIRGEPFVNLGPAIADVVFDSSGIPHVARVVEIGVDDASRQRIGWGAASWLGDDGYVYVYGTANPEEQLVFGWSLHVARTTPDRVFDPSAWETWEGSGWGHDPDAAAPLIDAVGGVSQTLSVVQRDGTWYAVSKRDDFLGHDVAIWSAPAPTGPFGTAQSVAYRPSDTGTGIIHYAALAHPDLFPENGTMVVSISQNTTDHAALVEDPTLYRPEFFRVPLPAGPEAGQER